MDLREKRCVPCEGGIPKLSADEAAKLGAQVPKWRIEGEKLHRRFEHPDFRAAIAFVNRMADLAEAEGHHPNFAVDYAKVDVTVWTHAIGGLSENDFILAAKIDRL